MTHAFSTEGLQDLLRFPFQAERAGAKLAIAAVMLLGGIIIPIIPSIFLLGYLYQIMKTVIHTGSLYLPEWDDWGKLFRDGLKFFGVSLVYGLPVAVLFTLVFGSYLVTFIGVMTAVDRSHNSDLAGLFSLVPFVFFVFFALVYLLQMIVSVVLPVALGNAAAKDRFAAGFHFGEMWRVFKANFLGYVLAYLLAGGMFFALSFISTTLYMSMVLCCLLPVVGLVVSPYLAVVVSALFAQVYREGLLKQS